MNIKLCINYTIFKKEFITKTHKITKYKSKFAFYIRYIYKSIKNKTIIKKIRIKKRYICLLKKENEGDLKIFLKKK